MEEASKQLQNLTRIKEYPSLLKKIEQLEYQVGELTEKTDQQASEIESLRAVERMVGDQKLTIAQLKEIVTKTMEEEIERRAKLRFQEMKEQWKKPKKVIAGSILPRRRVEDSPALE